MAEKVKNFAPNGRSSDLDDLRRAIDGDRARLCRELGLRSDGNRFFCPACQADGANHNDGDLSVEAGFRCHKCGWHGNGFDLIQFVRSCDFPAAAEFARRAYGVPGIDTGSGPKNPSPRKQGKIHATMEDAAAAALWGAEKQTNAKLVQTRTDIYKDVAGVPVAAVLRFDHANGATDDDGKALKAYRPIHAVEGGWATKDPPGLWSLFRLPDILATDKAVYVTEGEKAAEAGVSIGLECTTTAHGAKSPRKTDLAPLRDRDVLILPDNDKAGREYAEIMAGLAYAAGAASVRIVPLPGLPPKGDIADYIALHPQTTPAALCAKIEALAKDAPVWTPPAAPEPPVPPGSDAPPIEAAKAGAPYACTDLGNAERLAAYHGTSIRWDTARKCWRVWDGRRWAADSALKAQALAANTARRIREEAAAAPSNNSGRDVGRELFGWAIKSESRDRLAAMLEVAKSCPGIAVAADALDADPMLLNVLNGTIDLRTGLLRPHDRCDLITKLAPVEFIPGHRDERWEKFLETATQSNAALIDFMQLAAGYTLTGDTSEEKLFFVYGPENSGKTTFLESMRAVLGEYARTIQTDLLTRQRESRGGGAASPELAALAGARLAAGSEMEQGRELAEALAKNLTGGEQITARYLYAELFDFQPQFKIWLAMNHCPKVGADDGAIWRRILRIGFDHIVPPEQRDKTLKPYLRNPKGGGPAVLAWAVDGCLRWQKEGLDIPEAVRRSTEAYRTESDPLATFFEDCLTFNPLAWAPWTSIWSAYCDHATEMGIQERYRIAPKRLQERLRAKGCTAERRFSGRGWRGVELVADWIDARHVGHDGCDGNSQTFSSDSLIRKVSEKASAPSCPSCYTPELPFEEGDAADLADALQREGQP